MFFPRVHLRSVKQHPQAGAVSASVHEKARARLLAELPAAVFESAPSTSPFVWLRFQSYISRPVAAFSALIVFFTGGWMTTSAAQESLPGDTLYNVKKITEQAQLQLASRDRRAILHTEFAQRRLEEVVALREVAQQEPHRAPRISETVAAYQSEITSATQDLHELQQSNQPEVLAIASEVLSTVAVLKTTAENLAPDTLLEVPVPSAPQTSLEEDVRPVEQVRTQEDVAIVNNVQASTQTIEDAATTLVIDAHEQSPSSLSTRETGSLFRDLLGENEARRTVLRHRIDTLETLMTTQKQLLAQSGIIFPDKSVFARMRTELDAMEKETSDTMNGFAAGGVRTAFESLAAMSDRMGGLEAQLLHLEEQITQAFTEQQP